MTMTDNKPTPPPQYAVWFFVAATFVFAMPVTLYRGSAELWVTIVSVSVGMLLVVLGSVQLGREVRARQAGPPPEH
jgi:protein-S-isoprenylcysteine O-methyltransferase Ste14